MKREKETTKLLLNVREAAEALNISTETLGKYKSDGKISSVMIGRRCLFSRANLEEFIRLCTVPLTVPPSSREKLEMSKRLA